MPACQKGLSNQMRYLFGQPEGLLSLAEVRNESDRLKQSGVLTLYAAQKHQSGALDISMAKLMLSWNHLNGGSVHVSDELVEKRLGYPGVQFNGLTATDAFYREVLALYRLRQLPSVAGLCSKQFPQLVSVDYERNALSVRRIPASNTETVRATLNRSNAYEQIGCLFRTLRCAGIVHQDLSCRNLLFDTEAQTLHLIDFENSALLRLSGRDGIGRGGHWDRMALHSALACDVLQTPPRIGNMWSRPLLTIDSKLRPEPNLGDAEAAAEMLLRECIAEGTETQFRSHQADKHTHPGERAAPEGFTKSPTHLTHSRPSAT